ncbi:MAG TPA: TonB-dependent receptor [Cyclobacteriaceae bacterium]|nr:TonB-dependent receptor [Cyclobacteriaceae bacterium]
MSLLLFVLVLSSIHPISATPANASGFPLTDSSRSVVLDTAETNESYRIMELEEVTVVDLEIVLRKKESSNVTFIREDYIRQNRGGSLMKSLERLPGISTIGIGSGSSKPLIRGLGFNQVMVVENGIKHEGQQWGADHGLEIDQYAVDRLTVIKGPASFKFGSDAIAGVVDIQSKLPSARDGIGGSVEIGGKSNNAWAGGSTNLFARQGKWFADSRLTYASYGDFRVPSDSVFVYDFGVKLANGRARNTAGREYNWSLQAGFIADRFRNTITFSSVRSKAGFFANAHGLEPRQVDSEHHDASSRDILLPYQEVVHTKIINRLQYLAGKHLFEFDLGFQRNFREEWSQYVNHGFMPPVYPSESPYPSSLERLFDKDVFSINLRDEIFLEKHSLTIGGSAELQVNNIGGWGFLVPSYRQFSYGFYAIDKYKASDLWQLSGALRFDRSRIQIQAHQDWFPSVSEDRNQVDSDYLFRSKEFDRDFNSLVWSAGFNYTPGEISLKGNLGSSFRMPIAKELGANGVNYHYFRYEKGNADLSPERSLQFDLGAELNKQSWQISFSPFMNYFPNYIYLNPSFEHDFLYGAGNQIFNYSQSEVLRYGGEVSALHQLTKALSFEFLGEYVYSEQLSGDKKGYTLPFSTAPSALLNATYRPKDGGFFQNAYLAVDYRMTGRQSLIVPPEKVTPGYQLVHLRMGSGLVLFNQLVDADLQVQNLFNTKYLNHTSFYRLIDLPEPGRNISLSLKYKF